MSNTKTTTTHAPARPHGRTRPGHLLASLLSAGLLAVVIAGCHKAPPPAKPSAPLPVNSFMRVWNTTLDLAKKDQVSELHVRDDNVYAYSRGGRVTGLKRDTGTTAFAYDVKGGNGDVLRPPVVLKDYIAYPTLTTIEVYTRDGRFVRSTQLPFAVRTNASGAGPFVFLAGDYPGGGARVAKVDVTQAYVPVRWDFMGLDAGRTGYTAGTQVLGDAVYAAGLDGSVYAVHARTRESLWPIPQGVFHAGGAVEADLVADSAGVYIASTDSVLYVVNPNSGRLKWRYYAGTALRDTPVVTPDRVYLKVRGKGILAFAKNEGKEVREPLWTRSDVKQVLSQDDRFTYARAADDRLVAIDKTTGETRFESKRKDFAVFGVNPKGDGVIFVATKAGDVLAAKGVFQPGVIGELVRADDAASADAFADAAWEPVAR